MIKQSRVALGCLRAVGVMLGFAAAPVAAADQHPDLNGVWTWYIEPGKAPFAGPFAGPPLPFTKAAKAKVDEYTALTAPTSDNPSAHCLGTGMPGSMLGSGGYPMEILETPKQITIIYEAHTEVRRLYFDNRIPESDRIPGRNGYSSAHWDGDTLVVETGNLEEQVDQRYAHSADAKIVEKYHLSTDGKGNKLLIADMTMTDPAFYTKPVTDEKKWAFVPNGFLLPYECDEEGWLDHLQQLKDQAAKAAAPANNK